MNYIDALQQRYSVKKFDGTPVPEDKLMNILQAGRLAASSLGLQPYRIYIVQDPAVLQKLTSSFYNPSQISTCSHLIAIAVKRQIETTYVDDYLHRVAETRGIDLAQLQPFRNNIISYTGSIKPSHLLDWSQRQAYIVLGNLLFAAALEGVDTCPMEGFKQGEIEKVLGINPENEVVSVTLALGYRSEDDPMRGQKKVRKPDDELFHFF